MWLAKFTQAVNVRLRQEPNFQTLYSTYTIKKFGWEHKLRKINGSGE